MPGGGVHDLMADDGGEFRLGAELRQQPAVECQFAARQCPGVGHGTVEDDEFVRQVALGDRQSLTRCDKLLADTANVFGQLRIDVVLAATGLLHVVVIFLAQLYFLGFADHREFALPGDRVDRAGRKPGQQPCCREQTEKRSHYGIYPQCINVPCAA